MRYTFMRTLRPSSFARLLTSASAVSLLVLLAAAPLAALPRAERHETRHEIDQLEEDWRTAVLDRNVTALDALLSDDYMAITSHGMLQSKDETLASLRSGAMRIKSITYSDRKVRFYGATALVTSRVEVDGTGPEGNLAGSYRYTRVYVRGPNGNWRIVSFEASSIHDDEHH